MAKRPSDPTMTVTLRRYFVGQFNSRFAALAKLIKMSVVENDCLNINPISFRVSEPYVPDTWKNGLSPLEKDPYPFRRTSAKIQRFLDWLAVEENKSLFQIINYENFGEGIDPIWSNVYIREFYKKGIRWGREQLNAGGFRLPTDKDSVQMSLGEIEHVDRLGAVYTRAFTDLKGITAAMDSQISSALAEGLRKGSSPKEIAKILINRVDKVGKHRAILLARTESIRAHHLASMQEYRNAGVNGVTVKAEWSTAGDGRVCRRCAPLDYDRTGKVFTVDEIEGLIPLHPQCRCAALPHIEELEGLF